MIEDSSSSSPLRVPLPLQVVQCDLGNRSGGGACVSVHDGSAVALIACRITSGTGSGVLVEGGSFASLVSCTIQDCGAAGLTSNSGAVGAAHCRIFNCSGPAVRVFATSYSDNDQQRLDVLPLPPIAAVIDCDLRNNSGGSLDVSTATYLSGSVLTHNNRLDNGTMPSQPIGKAERIALYNAAMDDSEKRELEEDEEEEDFDHEKGNILSRSGRRVKRRRLNLLNADDAKVAHTVHVLEERLPGVTPMSRQDLAPSRLRAGLGGSYAILGRMSRRRVYLLPCKDGSEIFAVTSLKRRPIFHDPASGQSISFLDAMDLSVTSHLEIDVTMSECEPRVLIPVIIEQLLAQLKSGTTSTTTLSSTSSTTTTTPTITTSTSSGQVRPSMGERMEDDEEENEKEKKEMEDKVYFNHSIFTVVDSNALGGFAQIASTREIPKLMK
jgi:hypothetical protein